MKKNYWTTYIERGDVAGSWTFRKFIQVQDRATPYDFLNIIKSVFPNIKFFKPKVVNLRYSPAGLSVKEFKKYIKYCVFTIPRSKFNSILDREIEQFKTKTNIGAGLTYIFGETLLYLYERSGIVKKWKTLIENESPKDGVYTDFLCFHIFCTGFSENKPYISFVIDTHSDIWLSKVEKVNDKTFQHYDNTELARLNSKTLSSILKSVKKSFNPDEIETWSEIDQEACEKNWPNKLVTETGFNQKRIKEIWGDR